MRTAPTGWKIRQLLQDLEPDLEGLGSGLDLFRDAQDSIVRGNYARAMELCHVLLDIARDERERSLYSTDTLYIEGISHLFIASLHSDQERFKEAKEHYSYSRDHFRWGQWNHLESLAYLGLAMTQRALGRVQEAAEKCGYAREIIISHQSVSREVDATTLLEAINREILAIYEFLSFGKPLENKKPPPLRHPLPSYLDFDLEIGPGQGREYPVTVVRSPAGEARETMRFPYDEFGLETHLKDLQIALLRSGGRRRRVCSPEEQAVQDFGRSLFEALLIGEVRSRYDVSLREAASQGKGLRLKLRIQAADLTTLPWEFLYDPRPGEYVCLSRNTPVVRYLELPQPITVLSVELPLRILGMIASPNDLPHLDVGREKQRVERAIKYLQANGLVDLTWLPGQTQRDLQRAMRRGPWHIFHFIGHGGFDRNRDEGFLAFANEEAETHRLSATQLGRLLGDHFSLRLVLLNACEGARGGGRDVFSSVASILVRRGIPAVLAMQYEITDRAAIELAQAFYEALADGMPVDAAVAEARKAISVAVANTVEWGTPVLYMRSLDGLLFSVREWAVDETWKQFAEPGISEDAAQPELRQLQLVAEPKKVSLQAWNGQYVCAVGGGGGEVLANRKEIDEWAKFDLIEIGNNKIQLRAHNGDFVCAVGGGGGRLVANRRKPSEFETFDLFEIEGDKVYLRTHMGQYVSAAIRGEGDAVVATQDIRGEYETFRLIRHFETKFLPIPLVPGIGNSSLRNLYLDPPLGDVVLGRAKFRLEPDSLIFDTNRQTRYYVPRSDGSKEIEL